MKIHARDDPDRPVLWVSVEGRFGDDDLAELIQTIRREAASRSLVAVVVDLSSISDVAVSSKVVEVTGLRLGEEPLIPGVPFAFVAPTDVLYGMVRMYTQSQGGERSSVHRDRAGAEAWLETLAPSDRA